MRKAFRNLGLITLGFVAGVVAYPMIPEHITSGAMLNSPTTEQSSPPGLTVAAARSAASDVIGLINANDRAGIGQTVSDAYAESKAVEELNWLREHNDEFTPIEVIEPERCGEAECAVAVIGRTSVSRGASQDSFGNEVPGSGTNRWAYIVAINDAGEVLQFQRTRRFDGETPSAFEDRLRETVES